MPDGTDWGTSFAMASTGSMSFYDDIMVPRLFEPWAILLLDELHLRGGLDVLDLACGPGTVARLAALRVGASGKVTGCDLSGAMLEIARSKPTLEASAPIDYVECAADSIDLPDNGVDVVTCQQGLQFFPNRPAALAEMRRTLRPGGQLGVAVWCDIEECPPFAALANALEKVLGTDAAETYRSGPWGLGDSDSLGQLVTDSEFDNVRVRRHELPVAFEGGPRQLLMTLHATAVASTLNELSASDMAALVEAVDESTRDITSDGVVHSYAASNIVTANRGER